MQSGTTNLRPGSGFWEKSLKDIFENIALPVLGWVGGIVCLMIIVYGGFQYMQAGGDTKKTADARKTLLGGVIGIAIITAAYSIITIAVSVGNQVAK